MSSIVLSGDTSGSVTVSVPAVAGNNTVTIPATTGTVMVSSNMPAFSAYGTGVQSISNATFTKLTFGTEVFDTNNNFASSIFQPTVAGYYQVNYATGLSITAGVLGQFLFKNGSSIANGGYVGGANNVGGATWVTGSNLVYMNGSTDYLEVYTYQTSGASANTVAGQNGTWFNGSMVRAA